MISTSSSLETEAGFVLRSLMLPVGYDNTTNTDPVKARVSKITTKFCRDFIYRHTNTNKIDKTTM